MSTKQGSKGKGKGSKVVAKGKPVVKATRGKKARAPRQDAVPETPPAVQAVPAVPVAVAKPAKAPKALKAPRARDARLPEVGTPMVRKWRGHEVVVTEQADGTFLASFDGEDLPPVKSLTKAAEMALAKEGITSGVNGFVWFKVGTPDKAPRARKGKSLEALAAEVERLQARFVKAAERAAKAEAALDAATTALADARAAAESAPAA